MVGGFISSIWNCSEGQLKSWLGAVVFQRGKRAFLVHEQLAHIIHATRHFVLELFLFINRALFAASCTAHKSFLSAIS